MCPNLKKNGFLDFLNKNLKKNCPEVVIDPEVRKSIMTSGQSDSRGVASMILAGQACPQEEQESQVETEAKIQ